MKKMKSSIHTFHQNASANVKKSVCYRNGLWVTVRIQGW